MSTQVPSRRTRSDAARNADRIVRAAGDIFARQGVDVSLQDIARHAGVGVATLYRHFANKSELVRAVIELAYATDVQPVLTRFLAEDGDGWSGLVAVFDAAMTVAWHHRNAIAATQRPGKTPLDIVVSFFDGLSLLLRRAQRQGTVRTDLDAADLPWLASMIMSTMAPDDTEDGWRRYFALLLDALRPRAASSLPISKQPDALFNHRRSALYDS